MVVSTSGQISITPVRIVSDSSLEQLSSTIGQSLYTGRSGTRGWGSVFDDTDNLIGQVVRNRPSGGAPDGVVESEQFPDQVRARLYWDERDPSLERVLGQAADATTISRFRAADITIASTGVDGEYLGLLAERNESRLRKHVFPGLETLLQNSGGGGTFTVSDNALEFGDDDFFRWLLYRYTHDQVLSDDLSILEVRSMGNQDHAYRTTAMGRGVELDRADTLALLAIKSNNFGPAKFVVWYAPKKLTLSLEVRADGQFAIYRGGSEYEYETHEDVLPHDLEGIELLQDAAFNVLPELKRFHNADSEWRDTHRAEFIDEARQLLKKTLGIE